VSTVLIVDDEKNIRTSLATTFELENYRVVTAADGLRALDAVEGGGIDLVLLDLQMPELDGLGVQRRSCSRRPTPCAAPSWRTRTASFVRRARAGTT